MQTLQEKLTSELILYIEVNAQKHAEEYSRLAWNIFIGNKATPKAVARFSIEKWIPKTLVDNGVVCPDVHRAVDRIVEGFWMKAFGEKNLMMSAYALLPHAVYAVCGTLALTADGQARLAQNCSTEQDRDTFRASYDFHRTRYVGPGKILPMT